MAGTITHFPGGSDRIRIVTINFTADAADASYPNDVPINGLSGHLTNAYYKPGTTPPTTGLTGVTVEWNGIDLLGGGGAAIATAANALITPKNTIGDAQYAGFSGPIIPKCTGNAINSATFTLVLVIAI